MGHQRGFTLLELLLVVACIGLFAGIGAPVYVSFQQRNDLDVSVQRVASAVRRARVSAAAMEGDSDWGVYVQDTSVTLYRGNSYAARVVADDEVTDLSGVTVSASPQELRFQKFSGNSVPASASLTLTSNANESRTITVNAKGLVDY